MHMCVCYFENRSGGVIEERYHCLTNPSPNMPYIVCDHNIYSERWKVLKDDRRKEVECSQVWKLLHLKEASILPQYQFSGHLERNVKV